MISAEILIQSATVETSIFSINNQSRPPTGHDQNLIDVKS